MACQPACAPAASVQVCKFNQEPLCSCALHSIGNRSDLIFGLPNVALKRQDVGQITKQYNNNRAKCGIPSSRATSKRRSLFAVVQSARGYHVRGGGFGRSEALTSPERRYDSGLCMVACVPRQMCANKGSRISAPVHICPRRAAARKAFGPRHYRGFRICVPCAHGQRPHGVEIHIYI